MPESAQPPRATGPRTVGRLWISCVALVGATIGLALGCARLGAIDGGATDLAPGRTVGATGHVAAVPRRANGEVRFPLSTPDGRLMVEAREPVGDLSVGGIVRVRGTIADPDPLRSAELARLGIADVLVARSITVTERRRGGLAGALDGVRERAEAALERGTEPAAASLLRGFVLGQDDRIDPVTVDEFRRSGLAHLLAVSGQNVILLALLAGAVLAALDVPLRARLLWVLVTIAIYVPVAGAGPSIQRAGVVGAVGIVAALASRPRSRWYALLVAAAVTLGLNPRASGDVGWQLSFAAVAGILLWARRIADSLAGGSRPRRALAEGVGVTVAATLATAPLMAHHFDAVSLVSLAANLLALPAVAPVMWLGMLAGAAGQLPWLPIEPLTWFSGLLAGYIAQVAEWLAAPGWAQAGVSLDGAGLVLASLALATTVELALRSGRRRRGLRTAGPVAPAATNRGAPAVARGAPHPQRLVRLSIIALAIGVLVLAALAGGRSAGGPDVAPGLRLTVLDVGQGDAILLQPARGDPVLVDAGPAEAGVADQLRDHGVDRLAAVVVTHAQDDHAGGVADVLARLPTQRLVVGAPDRSLAALGTAHGVPVRSVAAGEQLRSGPLRVEVLWAPRELVVARRGVRFEDPNRLSLALIARWREFEALLTGDAEAEAATLDPGPLDVLKVAHHGSADTGLDGLLARSEPRLALISVGEDNPYGHPAPATLGALRKQGVPTLRTDRSGEIAVEVSVGAWTVR